MTKPIVLWTCDVRGWAYYIRVVTMRDALPQYEHRVWISSNMPPSLLKGMMDRADIVMSQGVKPIARILQAGAVPQKVVCRVDSVRIDHNGVYVDIFKAKEVA